MKTLVTGSEGFIGRHVMARLPNAVGYDLANGKNVAAYAPPGYDRYIHLAAIPGIARCAHNPTSACLVNTLGTARVLEAARVSAAMVVFASSAAAAFGRTVYAQTKRDGENWCELYRSAFGIDAQWLRLGNVYGPGSARKSSVVAAMCRDAVTRGRVIVHDDGHQRRDLVHVLDVVEAIDTARDSDCPGWGVVTGVAPTMLELGEHIAELSGARLERWSSRTPDMGGQSPPAASVPLDYTPWRDGVEETYRWFEQELG